MSKEYAYSEIFYSIQGEGKYTGIGTSWVRFFLCNLQCNGFGQDRPTKPETYILPYKDLDVSQYKTMEELPVFNYGCDSSYSWSKKYKHLAHKNTAVEIANKIMDSMKNEHNPMGLFKHPLTGQVQHLCFTGGEPLMKHGQEAIVEIMDYLYLLGNIPSSVTIETNGTQSLSHDFIDAWYGYNNTELFFSVSPKLFSVSGELPDKAIKPDVVSGYHLLSREGQLKFVINGTKQSWDELEEVIDQFREDGVDYPVYIMPVGATLEGQEKTAGDVAKEAFERGYNVSVRAHVYLWGNTIGV